MKSKLLTLLLLTGFILSGMAQPAATTNKPAVKDPAFDPVIDDPNLPSVLLIGDSISIGYTVPVQKLLRGKANVHRIPENGGPTTNGLAKLDFWLGKRKWDVIHFNFGLHDLRLVNGGNRRILPEAYGDNLRNIVLRLKATHAKLIWATTTPVPPNIATKGGRRTEDVPIYNDVAAKIMEENKIAVDDLYSLILPQVVEVQRPGNVHYTNAGYEILGKAVVASIESALAAKK